MARLTCRCMNVAVHCKTKTWNSRPVEGRKVLPRECEHRLCDITLYEVDLDVAGITTKHAVLLLAVTLGDWIAQTCSNCGCDVCITHSAKQRVFVCPGLLATEDDRAQVRGHPHYSTVFGISLDPDLEADGPVSRPRVLSMSFGRDDPVIRQAHAQVKEFLAREEEAVERRIREFELREKSSFARLRQRTFTHRTLLFTAIAMARESGRPETSPSPPLPQSHSSHPPILTHSTSLPQSSHPKQRVTITLSDAGPRPNKPEVDDALFSLDGFEDEEEEVDGGKRGVAFPQSDDEESGTDDSSYRDMSSVQPVIASSVPLVMPAYKSSQEVATSYEEAAPTDMASSIQALALSVQNTGVFGDLPRPRVSSASHYK